MHNNISCYLFFEVAYGVLICISEEVEDFMLDVVFLQVVHQMCTVALPSNKPKSSKWNNRNVNISCCTKLCSHLDLLVGGDRAEDDFREALRRKHSETDPSNNSTIFDQ